MGPGFLKFEGDSMASNTIMSRLRSNFSDQGSQLGKPEALTRYMGGHNRKNHPFVSGYWQLYLSPPQKIFGTNTALAIEWFHATCEGFTPPSRAINKADVPGQGGLGSSYVTGQSLTRTFSITFREYRDLPISNLIELWTSVIDPYTGVSELSGSEWLASSYKGSAFVVLTKPTGAFQNSAITAADVEQVFFFHGVFPENPPYDTLASDISANDVMQYNLTFSFDGFPLTKVDSTVTSNAIRLLSGTKYMTTYDDYLADLTSVSS